MKIKGFIARLVISLIVAFPLLYWCRNIVDETTRIDVIFMSMMALLFVVALLIAWLVYPLFKK
ncbi:hypothetical protein [Enterobacter sp. KBR-315C3_2022]|uniref:hypothetical protein n=1 Tax=Enterobacter sp. KBR-315C3_2022 TaxID=3242494 RepID=UPI0035282C2C